MKLEKPNKLIELITFLEELILLENPKEIQKHYEKIKEILKNTTLIPNDNYANLESKSQILEDLKLYYENPNFGRANIETTIYFLKTL